MAKMLQVHPAFWEQTQEQIASLRTELERLKGETRPWFGVLGEYLDEGSVVVDAATAEDAERQVREMLADGDAETEISVWPAKADDIYAHREEMEKLTEESARLRGAVEEAINLIIADAKQRSILPRYFNTLRAALSPAPGEDVLYPSGMDTHRGRELWRALNPTPTPPDVGLIRYGIRWRGPTEPISEPMPDGFWTPWHAAALLIGTLQGVVDSLRAEVTALRHALSEQAGTIASLTARAEGAAVPRPWFGVLGEYMDEGSVVVDAVTAEDADRQVRRMLADGDAETMITVWPVKADDVHALREEIEKRTEERDEATARVDAVEVALQRAHVHRVHPGRTALVQRLQAAQGHSAADLVTILGNDRDRAARETDKARAEVERVTGLMDAFRADRDNCLTVIADLTTRARDAESDSARLRGAVERWIRAGAALQERGKYGLPELQAAAEALTAALSPAPEIVVDAKDAPDRLSGASADALIVDALSPAPVEGEAERSIDECPACGGWMPQFSEEVHDGIAYECKGCGAEVTGYVVDGRAWTEAAEMAPTPGDSPSPWDPRASKREPSIFCDHGHIRRECDACPTPEKASET